MNEIRLLKDRTQPTVALSGRIDSTNAAEMEAQIKELLKDVTNPDVVLDADNLEYISSAGLRVLLTANSAMSAKGGMKVINVNELVQEVFKLTSFTAILTIE